MKDSVARWYKSLRENTVEGDSNTAVNTCSFTSNVDQRECTHKKDGSFFA